MILLDSDFCIEILSGNQELIQTRSLFNDDLAICFITVAELYYSAYKSNNYIKNRELIEDFLFSLYIFQSDNEIMTKFGEIKSKLRLQNITVADAVLFIAACSLVKCNHLVTGNVKHFDKIERLSIINWRKENFF